MIQMIPSPVLSDPIKISQIVTNLLSNAIKYSDNGEIVISTKLESLSLNRRNSPQSLFLILV